MIKANELRTGNYVQYTPEPNDVEMKVASLSTVAINGFPESQFEPIRLTPELLENCGFKRGGDSTSRPSGPYHKGFCEVTVRNEYYDPQFFQPNGTALPHLHQLQNLYFALTGKELDVKL